jgi:hypothetical protein
LEGEVGLRVEVCVERLRLRVWELVRIGMVYLGGDARVSEDVLGRRDGRDAV